MNSHVEKACAAGTRGVALSLIDNPNRTQPAIPTDASGFHAGRSSEGLWPLASAELLHGRHAGRHRAVSRRVPAGARLAERADRHGDDDRRRRRHADDGARRRADRRHHRTSGLRHRARHLHRAGLGDHPAVAEILAGRGFAGRDRDRRARRSGRRSRASRSASCGRPASTGRTGATRRSIMPATWSAPALSGFLGWKFGFAAVFLLAAAFGVLSIVVGADDPARARSTTRRARPRRRARTTTARPAASACCSNASRCSILAAALACFHLGNGAMLPLYGLAVVAAKQGDPGRLRRHDDRRRARRHDRRLAGRDADGREGAAIGWSC